MSCDKTLFAGLILLFVLFDAQAASVNVNSDYFHGLYNIGLSWIDGYLERALVVFEFLIGALVGFVRGSALPPLLGFGLAIITGIAPEAVDGVFGALI